MNIKYRALHWCHQQLLKQHGKQFSEWLANPAARQAVTLSSVVDANATSDYGRAYDFKSIKDIDSFRQLVPITSHTNYEGYVDKIRTGEQNQLTSEAVTFFEPTSGSSGKRKLIPYTNSLLDAFNAATKPWLFNLTQHYPKAFSGRHYWSISPAHEQTTFDSTLPIGMADDSEYFDPISRFFINNIMAVPSSVRGLKSEDEWRFRTAVSLLSCRDLSLISVWSPTFLTVLFDYIRSEFSPLLMGLSRRRRREILSSTSEFELDFESIWPSLGLVSCWADGVSGRFAKNLKKLLPTTPVQGKGLLTTECVVSIPWQSFNAKQSNQPEGHVLAVGSHFLEFISVGSPLEITKLAHELVVGEQYTPVVTTQGGLYRYQLQDVVECVGYEANTPKIKFIGKQDHISDLAGEKIHSGLIELAMRVATQQTNVNPDFAMVSPPSDIPGSYCVFIESSNNNEQLDAWVNVVDKQLNESHHYHYAQRLGQLKPLVWLRTQQAWQSYQNTKQQKGMKLGDIKPTVLETQENWHQIFSLDESKVKTVIGSEGNVNVSS